jgi:hypothetical protein
VALSSKVMETVIRSQLLLIECVKDLDLSMMADEHDAALEADQYKNLTVARDKLEEALDELTGGRR